MQRHVPDNLSGTVSQSNISHGIGLNHTHFTSREIGNEYTECNWNQQKWLVFLDDAKIKETESNQIHQDERRLFNDAAYRSHVIEPVEYFYKSVHIVPP